MDIKEIVADNLIALRKKHNLTQNELAQKLNYSDNAVSRWERGEVTPSIETLAHISEIFNIPLSSLIEKDITKTTDDYEKKQAINRLAVILIFASIVWFIATIAFVYGQIFFHKNFWQVFIWAVPCTCVVLLPFNKFWGRYIFQFVIYSVFQWSLLASIYFQFIEYNLWLIFIIGIPVQVGLAIWAFIKPKKSNK